MVRHSSQCGLSHSACLTGKSSTGERWLPGEGAISRPIEGEVGGVTLADDGRRGERG